MTFHVNFIKTNPGKKNKKAAQNKTSVEGAELIRFVSMKGNRLETNLKRPDW